MKINLSSRHSNLCTNIKGQLFPIYHPCDTSQTCSSSYWWALWYWLPKYTVHFVIKPHTSHTDKSSRTCFTLGLIKEAEVIANRSWRTGVAGRMRAGWPRWAHVPNKTQQASWDRCFDARENQTLCPTKILGWMLQLGRRWSTWHCGWQQCDNQQCKNN